MSKKNKQRQKPIKQDINRERVYPINEEVELLPFLLDVMKQSSRNSVKSILKRGQVTVDGKVITQHNHLLLPGQKLSIQTNQTAIKEVALEGLEIIYEDKDLFVIIKDAGLLSVAGQNKFELTVFNQLMHYVRQDHPKNRVYVVHRLDRDTSGVMLVAKSEEIKKKLQETWTESVTSRMYTALVEGQVRRPSGTITSWLTESKTFKVYSSSFDNGGKKAITHYKKIRSNEEMSLLEVNLETGRKNQIRVHMEEIGHPIVGDKKYGAQSNPLKRLGLHATTLSFIHPTTGKQMEFRAKVPKKFLKAAN
ncbi:RluA family pseudouridine synthase [Vagococcus sp.]|uniref:RluA family pseudouridine synthase n=1 Tax=Vagococcus sp. TaxID=1933889 RepID=UPI003F964D0E